MESGWVVGNRVLQESISASELPGSVEDLPAILAYLFGVAFLMSSADLPESLWIGVGSLVL